MIGSKKYQEVKNLKVQIEDFENKWKRALADYRNLEKRVQENQIDFVKYANAKLIDKLLPILDDLERATAHIKEKGLKLILNQFRSVLSSEGVEEIKILGEEFNPVTMDCVEMTKGQKNQVVEVIQKGYTCQGKVLRPAKVKVGRGK